MTQPSEGNRNGRINLGALFRAPLGPLVRHRDLLRTECPAAAPSSAPLGPAGRLALDAVPGATVRGERARTMRTLHPQGRADTARIRITA